jgi:hypothetical protein
VVYGSLAAVRHLRTSATGGKLINVGSVLSDFTVPEQGAYAAAKHAVKAFTNTLRLEIMHDRIPVSVTLIKPSAVASLYQNHARNYMDAPGRVPPPVYSPDLVADAILYAAQHDVRDLTVGLAGRVEALFQQFLPQMADPLFAALGPALQKDRRPGQEIVRDGNLYRPMPGGSERTDLPFVRERSLYTAMQTHPKTTMALALGGVAAGAIWLAARQGRPAGRLIASRSSAAPCSTPQ